MRFAFQARKLAPAMLEELGMETSWRCEVFRQGDEWALVAYDPEEIRSLLRAAGVDPRRVGRLYFAQQFLDQLEPPLRLGEKELLTVVDGQVVQLPETLLATDQTSNKVTELRRPRESFTFQSSGLGTMVSNPLALVLGISLLGFGLAWIVEGARYQREADTLQGKLETLLEKNPAYASALARRNILERYRSIDRQQREIRETVQRIGTLVGRDSKLASLRLDAKGYEARIEAPSSRLDTLKRHAKTSGLKAKVDAGSLRIQGKWQ